MTKGGKIALITLAIAGVGITAYYLTLGKVGKEYKSSKDKGKKLMAFDESCKDKGGTSIDQWGDDRVCLKNGSPIDRIKVSELET